MEVEIFNYGLYNQLGGHSFIVGDFNYGDERYSIMGVTSIMG